MKVVVGIPSFNNAETISHVAKVAAKGIMEFFDGDGMIVNSDGGSSMVQEKDSWRRTLSVFQRRVLSTRNSGKRKCHEGHHGVFS